MGRVLADLRFRVSSTDPRVFTARIKDDITVLAVLTRNPKSARAVGVLPQRVWHIFQTTAQ
jgi:hypothetical protein